MNTNISYGYNWKFCPTCHWLGRPSGKRCPQCREYRLVPVRQAIAGGLIAPAPLDYTWAIRFGGNEEKIYTPEIGFYHLQILLENPGTSFSASELDVAARRMTKNEPVASVSATEDQPEDGFTIWGQSDSGAVLDDKAIQSYRTRLEELEGELNEARSNNDLSKIESLENDKEWIISELGKAHGLGGKVRKLADERDKVRKRVSNAITRALKKIDQYDKPLSEHLKEPVINLGHSISYVPRDGLTWSTTPTSNN